MPETPLHTVIETPEFIAYAKRLLTEDERWALVRSVAADPRQGI